MKSIPAIDLFAGPGGLAEGFSSFQGRAVRFDVRMSIEKDPVACRTLRLRAFYRQFRSKKVPEVYYRYIKGLDDDRRQLETFPEWKVACDHVKQWNLGGGPAEADHVSSAELHRSIHKALEGARGRWVLLGGPPCQAYSVIGRVRMTGVGARVRSTDDPEIVSASRRKLEASFATDRRHTLYREYLRVVAVHQPAVFVMENVKGILSSQVPTAWDSTGHPSEYGRVFDQIKKDLENPWNALADDPDLKKLDELRQQFQRKAKSYRLRSFVVKDDGAEQLDDADFIIRSENYGVPQRRHRVIVLGIREDLDKGLIPLVPTREKVTVRQALAAFPAIRSALSKDKDTKKKYGEDSPVAWREAIVGEIAPALKSRNEVLVNSIKDALQDIIAAMGTGGRFVPSRQSLTKLPKPLREFLEDPNLGGVIQHQSRSHMASDLARYLYLAASTNMGTPKAQQSPTLKQWPASLLPRHANVVQDQGKRTISGFIDRFRVQAWDHPASTITAHIHKDGHYFVHPDPRQCRSLTVREAARLQTFPENYFFEGNKTEQFIQVGNAVPPYLALQLATAVAGLFLEKSA